MIKFLFCLLFLFFEIEFTSQKIITIKSNDNTFYDLKTIIKNNQNDEELVLKFNDSRYYMKELDYGVELNVETNIILSGNENKTVFDYGGEKNQKGKFFFTILKNQKNIKFENIIFENFLYQNSYRTDDIFIITISIYHQFNFIFSFENCIFRNNGQDLINFYPDVVKKPNTESILFFNKCEFM